MLGTHGQALHSTRTDATTKAVEGAVGGGRSGACGAGQVIGPGDQEAGKVVFRVAETGETTPLGGIDQAGLASASADVRLLLLANGWRG